MMKFDLTPLMAKHSNKILMQLALWAVPVLLLSYFACTREFTVSLFRGVVLGLLDTLIMFAGIRKALPYAQYPLEGLKIMRRYKVYRMLSAISVFLLMLKMKYYVAGLCIGFLLIHIFLIINLTFVAYRLNKEET